MTALKMYVPTDALAIAEAIRRDFEDRILDTQQIAEALSEFKLRDPHGVYWTVGPRSLQWYHHAQGQWSPASTPPTPLEGPASLALWVRSQKVEKMPEEQDTAEPAAMSIPEAFQAMVHGARAAYEGGRITSTDVESLLSMAHLVDNSKKVWTVGFRSGKWYSFGVGRWMEAPAPPTPETFTPYEHRPRACPSCGEVAAGGNFCAHCGTKLEPLVAETMDPFAAGVLQDLPAGIDVLPEAVTEEWNPPTDFPETLVRAERRACPSCGQQIAASIRFCTSCGADLQRAPPSPAPAGPTFCPQCGTRLEAGVRLCTNCGHRLMG